MRILITGMAGFIGFHCARVLQAEGHEILGLDNLNHYYDPRLKRARVDQLLALERVQFRAVDICDDALVDAAFRVFQPERVLHLAAQVGVRYSLENPRAYVQSNVVGTLNMLEACRNFGRPRLVYASSSSVYGASNALPYSEADAAVEPISLYAASKRSTELMAHSYSHLFGLTTIGLRFFTVYGPWGRPDMAVWLFTEAISKGRPIKVFNAGALRRDFTYVDDIVRGVRNALMTEGLSGYQVFNLGNSRSEPLGELISAIETAVGRPAEKVMVEMQAGDVLATHADTAKSAAALGFAPTTSIPEGIPRFVEWYRAHPEFHSA